MYLTIYCYFCRKHLSKLKNYFNFQHQGSPLLIPPYNHHFPVLELDDLLVNAQRNIPAILEKIKPIKLFEEYLQFGYYPFFREGEAEFQIKEPYGKPSF